MKKKHIGVRDLQLIVKALFWASQDRLSLAEAHGDETKCGKEASKEAAKCLKLRKLINEHLSSGGEGLTCSFDGLALESVEMLSLTDIKDRIESGEFKIEGNRLKKGTVDE